MSVPAHEHRREPHAPELGRRLVLVDVENVVGGAVLDETSAEHARRAIRSAVGTLPMDQTVVATCHKGYPHVAWCWPTAQRLVRSGPDGADLELLAVLRAGVETRFRHVVLVSGDGIFTDAVASLARLGVRVTVVARRDHIARRLRLAAWRVIYLNEDAVAAPKSAV